MQRMTPRELSRLPPPTSLSVCGSRRLWPLQAVLRRIANPCYRQNPLSPVKHAADSHRCAVSEIVSLHARYSCCHEDLFERLFREPPIAALSILFGYRNYPRGRERSSASDVKASNCDPF